MFGMHTKTCVHTHTPSQVLLPHLTFLSLQLTHWLIKWPLTSGELHVECWIVREHYVTQYIHVHVQAVCTADWECRKSSSYVVYLVELLSQCIVHFVIKVWNFAHRLCTPYYFGLDIEPPWIWPLVTFAPYSCPKKVAIFVLIEKWSW